ncbi:DUF934 domain-containing protein [Prosthecomicrobium sp. N25]|uniref:DUF934 domain-containing protein n=1 Tax=Prosthecomicrobium sp. N25 TaxID=3129254 RepID=UPI00307777C1
MTDVYRNGRFEADTWRLLADGEPVPPEGGVLLPKARFIAEVSATNAPFGLALEPSDSLDDLEGHLDRAALVTVKFPKFGDGRAFSLARLLRERHGYRGEIRAVGDVLIDLVPFMGRVGIDALVVTHEPTRRALAEGRLPLVPFFYQPAADGAARPSTAGRPWLRRPATSSAA